MNIINILFVIAIIGHLLCGYCDCLLTYIPGGKKFDVKVMKDNDAMAETFEKMPLKNPLISMLLGCFALMMIVAGYYGVYLWMSNLSKVYSIIILIGALWFFIFGVAHHVFCGAAMWFYVRLGRTEEARKSVVHFFKDTSITMILCYLGMAIFGVTVFIAVVTGATDLPRWACIFNVVPLYLLTLWFRVGGTGNWCGAIMFAGLLVLNIL